MILGARISLEKSMLVAEEFIRSLNGKYGKHNISTDDVPTSIKIP